MTNPIARGWQALRHSGLAGETVIALALFAVLVLTSPQFGLTWDEAYTCLYADQLLAGRYAVDIHPWLVRTLAALSRLAVGGQSLAAYRAGTMLLAALGAAALGGYAARRWGWGAGALAVALYAGVPAWFAHAHLAATDVPLASLWLLTTLAWLAALDRGGWPRWAAFAIALAFLLSVKITALLWFLPAALWLVGSRRGAGWRPTLLAALAAVALMLALQGLVSGQTPAELADWLLARNLQRQDFYPHWFFYLGEARDGPAPWHYGPVVLLVTLPPAVLLGLLLALAGWRRADRRPEDGLFLLTFLATALVTALPGAPGGDGNRYLLPAVPFAALLAARGWLLLVGRLAGATRGAAALALAALTLVPLARAWPYPMAYYNPLIFGEHGALACGFESSYWWETLNAEAIAQANRLLPANAVLALVPADPQFADRHRALRSFRPDLTVTADPRGATHLFILSRPRYDYPQLFHYAQADPGSLTPRWCASIDGVPLLTLYARQDAAPGIPAAPAAAGAAAGTRP